MPEGHGKYDEQCSRVREAVNPEAVVLIVIAGNQGSGCLVLGIHIGA